MARVGMTAWQQAQQIKYILKAMVWPVSPAKPVFGFVLATAAPKELPSQLGSMLPFAIIQVEDGDPDGSSPALSTDRWTIGVTQSNHGDPMGQTGLLGGMRAAGTSEGKGILEIEEELGQTISTLLGDCGLRFGGWVKGKLRATVDPNLGYVSFRSYRFETKVTMTRGYHDVYALTATDVGSGDEATLAWKAAPDRWDWLNYTIRRTASTSTTPPPTITDGVLAATITTRTTTTYTDDPGGGDYAWSIFTQYDESHDPDLTAGPTTATATSAGAGVTVEVT